MVLHLAERLEVPLRERNRMLLALLAELETYPAPPAPAHEAAQAIALNVLWAADSIAFLATGLSHPTAAGAGWIVMQALVVGGFAALQTVARSAARNRAVAA